ncbi:aminotransferase class I/II-fold pyridoxal phosphate-dependent enzyme [Vibrio sp. Of14-4]|uniref:aminotransferase class I/II-fold pyridoxal phosphate-dependent enzyme n=1 Tax=Vibrio sp. Of14-4 TaxID=2724878 RepID=UPI001EF1D52F|nr:aminotransferase class I/II-fold pyridoxal phosphate-dependent enzyme [Vibrio sp. Of14-4]MCG7489653.1 aminotransferase class I/II-fold pyridoxal phosphate-dependent enzyme [Vibrio sp. Of14-4]
MIKKLVCNLNYSLIEVMKVINENAMNIAFVVDEDLIMHGVVTDGDIRRALLNDTGLQEPVRKILSPSFSYGYTTDSHEKLLSKVNEAIRVIPIVDEDFHLVDFFECKRGSQFPVAIPNLSGNEFKYLTDAFMSSWISSSGEYIARFEGKFSGYSDCEFGVAVSNGTAAIHLALLALDIGEDDEVIVPDLTFAASINAVLHANATPVIVDVEEESWCIDPIKIAEAITPKTKAIIPVHLYGQACDMESIITLANQYDLKVIEDCAEAHGAMYQGKKVGSFGEIGCFSFFGNKVITTGEGGMCVTNDVVLDQKMRVLRDHGMSKTKRYWHEVVGYNYRMTNLQAAIGLAQLERIDDIHNNRNLYEQAYRSVLDSKSFTFQNDINGRTKITWLVSVLLKDNISRNAFISILKDRGIDARPFFYPLSAMDIYKKYCKFETPVAHKISKIGLNLPTYESLKDVNEIRGIMVDVQK